MKIMAPLVYNFPDESDFYATCYHGTTANLTYTFPYDLEYVYCHVCANNSGQYGSYSGTGTIQYLHWSNYIGIVKIVNVKAGNTYTAPAFSASGKSKTIMSFLGKKAD